MSDENIIRGCGCSPDEACNLCGYEACQLAWQEITSLKSREQKLVEVVKFYADHFSWNHGSNVLGYQRITSTDLGETTWMDATDTYEITGRIGGKRAREVLKEIGVEL